MSFLTLQAVSAVSPDGRSLFSDLTFSLGHERIGLVGRNGCGKSTLFAMILGQYAAQSGSIAVNGSAGLLHQSPKAQARTLSDLLGVSAQLSRLARIEAGKGDEADFTEADWSLPARLEQAFAQVGLSGQDINRDIQTLSGGEATRANLARLLLEQPDFLLLDEPTNNLDADGRALVRDLLADWSGGALIASHDRDLLDTMDRIIHLSPVGVIVFSGGWSDFEAAREATRARAEADVEKAGRKLAQTNRGIQQQAERKASREAAGKTARRSRSQSKLALNAQKERAEGTGGRDAGLASRQRDAAEADLSAAQRMVEVLTPLTITLPDSQTPADKQLLTVSDLTLTCNGQPLCAPIGFELRGRDRLAICGRNGAGKSTLLRALMREGSELAPEIDKGETRIAMLDQHVSVLDPATPLLDQLLETHSHLSVNDAYAVLARFAFRNADARRTPENLSGGEKMRAGLALMTAGELPPHLLILDEPTNHLDIDSIELLEAALAEFGGAILAVSHDERFLQKIGCLNQLRLTKIID